MQSKGMDGPGAGSGRADLSVLHRVPADHTQRVDNRAGQAAAGVRWRQQAPARRAIGRSRCCSTTTQRHQSLAERRREAQGKAESLGANLARSTWRHLSVSRLLRWLGTTPPVLPAGLSVRTTNAQRANRACPQNGITHAAGCCWSGGGVVGASVGCVGRGCSHHQRQRPLQSAGRAL